MPPDPPPNYHLQINFSALSCITPLGSWARDYARHFSLMITKGITAFKVTVNSRSDLHVASNDPYAPHVCSSGEGLQAHCLGGEKVHVAATQVRQLVACLQVASTAKATNLQVAES